MNSMKVTNPVKVVAIVECIKGLVVVITGFGLLALIHQNMQVFADSVVAHLHLNPAKEIPRIFLEYSAKTDSSSLKYMAIFAFLYAAGRLIEAYGLWFERAWAEWLAIITAAIYVPFEVLSIVRGEFAAGLIALAVNTIVLIIMIRALRYRETI